MPPPLLTPRPRGRRVVVVRHKTAVLARLSQSQQITAPRLLRHVNSLCYALTAPKWLPPVISLIQGLIGLLWKSTGPSGLRLPYVMRPWP
ncbi:hypothetical protein ASPCADRAFT_210732 [Aspergillus carbonarius ITEM 5010]|uniref:Uncharacterized protein n=1 Tax=Aspergillus carbonarius (strain ITEM 5010) TaxID=602072 RepID=A0A1R3RB71_ASPC5|nr:hypothetical protein ASPCADRAFT_210732 [Aspergillus carbonarius ITEM 5010]